MKKIILSFIFYISIINITYAIPIPALVLWADFLIISASFFISIFSIVFFYFRKYWKSINLLLFILFFILYTIHFFITKNYFLFNNEYYLFILVLILLYFIDKKIKYDFLTYIILTIFLLLNVFLIYTDHKLLKLYHFKTRLVKEIWKDNIINNEIKDNFLVLYLKEKKEVVISNCFQWENDNINWLLLRNFLIDTTYVNIEKMLYNLRNNKLYSEYIEREPLYKWYCLSSNVWNHKLKQIFNAILK